MKHLFLVCLFYTGFIQCDDHYEFTTISSRSCATDDNSCFSYTFSSIEDLRSELKGDIKLREYIRQQIERQHEDGNGEVHTTTNPRETKEFTSSQIYETTTNAISNPETERPSTTTDTTTISPDIDRRESTTKIASQFTFATSARKRSEPTTSVESQTSSVEVPASSETASQPTSSTYAETVSTGATRKITDCERDSIVPPTPTEKFHEQLCVSYDSNMTNWDRTNGSCFYFVRLWRSRATYAEAVSNCSNIGGRLVAKGIRDGTIKAYLGNPDPYIGTCDCKRFWIGLRYSEDIWKWSDNCTYTESDTSWYKNFSHESNKRCALILRNKQNTSLEINTRECNDRRRYICEK